MLEIMLRATDTKIKGPDSLVGKVVYEHMQAMLE